MKNLDILYILKNYLKESIDLEKIEEKKQAFKEIEDVLKKISIELKKDMLSDYSHYIHN